MDDINLDDILDSALDEFDIGMGHTSHIPQTPTTQTSTQQTQPQNNEEFNSLLFNILNKLNQNQGNDQDGEGGDVDDLMSKMNNDGNMNGLLKSMLQTFVSKEVLYEPLMEMKTKYPVWLDYNKGKITEIEEESYIKQLGIIEQILNIYDTAGPDEGFDDVVTLMQDMQECGQPPIDIVKELAPGLEFDEDGVPKFPGFNSMGSELCSIL